MAHRSPQLQQQRLPGPTKRVRSRYRNKGYGKVQIQAQQYFTNSNATADFEFKSNSAERRMWIESWSKPPAYPEFADANSG